MFLVTPAIVGESMMESASDSEFSREERFGAAAAIMLRTLGHPDRLRILEFLMDGERTAGQIQKHLDIGQPRSSQHLSRMNDRGILECRKEGTKRFYSISNPFVLKLFGCFTECRTKVGSGEWAHLLEAFMEANGNDTTDI